MCCLLRPRIVTPSGNPEGASVVRRTRGNWLGFQSSAEDAPEKPCRLSGRGVSQGVKWSHTASRHTFVVCRRFKPRARHGSIEAVL
jgi:hypothetical protein